MSNLSRTEKRLIANALLEWLVVKKHKIWLNNYDILHNFATERGYHLFDVWKAYHLLRDVGRIEPNNPNGRKGAHVVSYAPIEKSIPSTQRLCSYDNCPVLDAVKHYFQHPPC